LPSLLATFYIHTPANTPLAPHPPLHYTSIHLASSHIPLIPHNSSTKHPTTRCSPHAHNPSHWAGLWIKSTSHTKQTVNDTKQQLASTPCHELKSNMDFMSLSDSSRGISMLGILRGSGISSMVDPREPALRQLECLLESYIGVLVPT
jgi:hypothetical protein